MLAPWWTHLACYFLLSTTFLPTLGYPVPTAQTVAFLDDWTELLNDPHTSVSFERRAPAPSSRHTQRHSTVKPKTEEVHAGPSSPGRTVTSRKDEITHKNAVSADDLKTSNYAEVAHALPRYKGAKWKGFQVDHLLEAQTVASKINKHLAPGDITSACLDALKVPINHPDNLIRLDKSTNEEKNHRVGSIANHDRFNHDDAPNMRGNKKYPHFPDTHVRHFSMAAAQHHIDHQTQLLRTADKVDRIMANPNHCPELAATHLGQGGKVRAQALKIISHAYGSVAAIKADNERKAEAKAKKGGKGKKKQTGH